MTFDPETFMQQTIDQPLAENFRVVPEGEYTAMIGDFDSTAFESKDFTYKRGAKAGQPGTMTIFNCPFIVQDETLKAELGRETITVYGRIMLDIDPATGGLDFGPDRNVMLGRIRGAVGQNNPGPWNPSQLRGAGPLMIRVSHRSDDKDPSRKYVEVKHVSKIA